ncbi:MAG: hypothetical protein K6A38_09775 [Lachnospiraceae bacterium]|nr:hypothetical protein [Lachnospiraceae bacterium]
MKLSKRLIAMTIAADMVFGSMLGSFTMPLQAFADVIPDNPAGSTVDVINAGDEMANNWGTVNVNNGTISNNVGTVNDNNGTIEHNFGNVIENNADNPVTTDVAEGIITNHTSGNVGNFDEQDTGGDVRTNFGTVNNPHKVDVNAQSGTVNGEGEIDYNAGTAPEATVNYSQESAPGVYEEIGSLHDGATAPVQPAAPEIFEYEPESTQYYEEPNNESGDSVPAVDSAVSDFQKMLKSDTHKAAVFNLDVHLAAVFASKENMANSTLYFTLEGVGPVGVVNLGADPDLSLGMIEAMYTHGGFFGFINNGQYIIVNLSNAEFREALRVLLENLKTVKSNPETDEGKDAGPIYVTDPQNVAVSSGTLTLTPVPSLDAPAGDRTSAGSVSRPSGVLGVRPTEAEGAVSGDTSVAAADTSGANAAVSDANKSVANAAQPGNQPAGTLVKVLNNEVPLADNPYELDPSMSWSWLLAAAVAAGAGAYGYDKNRKRVAANDEMKKYKK